jgi:hypothetical protein
VTIAKTEVHKDSCVVFYPGETFDDLCEHMLKVALEYNNGNITHTAFSLGIAIRTVRLWMRKYRIETGYGIQAKTVQTQQCG